jgi:hypothetical protein
MMRDGWIEEIRSAKNKRVRGDKIKLLHGNHSNGGKNSILHEE